MAAIPYVFTIGHVAKMVGEDEDWLFERSIGMFPEDGCLCVHGVGEHGVPALHRIRHRMPHADHCRLPYCWRGTDAQDNQIVPAARGVRRMHTLLPAARILLRRNRPTQLLHWGILSPALTHDRHLSNHDYKSRLEGSVVGSPEGPQAADGAARVRLDRARLSEISVPSVTAAAAGLFDGRVQSRGRTGFACNRLLSNRGYIDRRAICVASHRPR